MEKLSTFLSKSSLSREEREVLWTLLAHAMRASGSVGQKPLVKVVAGKTTLKELLHPFGHFLAAAGVGPEGLAVLESHLRGRESRFPFGSLVVDERGHVKRLEVDADGRAEAPRAAGRFRSA